MQKKLKTMKKWSNGLGFPPGEFSFLLIANNGGLKSNGLESKQKALKADPDVW